MVTIVSFIILWEISMVCSIIENSKIQEELRNALHLYAEM